MHLHFKSHPNLVSSKSARSSSLRKRASLLLGRSRFRMESFFSANLALLSKLRSVRYFSIFLGVSNRAVIILGAFVMVFISLGCGGSELLPFAFVSAAAAVRIESMIGTGMAQEATATTILSQPHADTPAVEAVIRHEIREMTYSKWWKRVLVVFFLILIWFLVLIQCISGSDVLRWRSFYET